MDRNKLAILVNQLGGYDEAENAIGVDAELLQRAVTGEQLTRIENAEIETGYNQLYLDKYLAPAFDLEIDELDNMASDLDLAINRLYDVDDGNIFREKVADGLIDTDDLRLYYGLFNNLAPGDNQRGKIIDYIQGDDEAEISKGLRAMLDGYLADGGNLWKDDSEFWEWFRETFYGDD